MIELRGVRNGNIWTKAEGKGHKHGFDLKEQLDSKGIVSLPDIFEFSSQKFKTSLCTGTRKILERKKVEEKEKILEKLVLGEYEWKTYEEVQQQILKVAAALKSLGFKTGDRVVILAETRVEWLISAIGCLRFGLTVVTLYTTLPDSGLVHGILETEIDTIFTSYEILPRLSKLLPQCEQVKTLIVFEDQIEGVGKTTVPSNIELIPFQTLLTKGNVEELTDDSKPGPEDYAIIMYTSGSTGTPKGVTLTHRNIFYSLIAYTIQANICSVDRYIAFLPLAHIMELVTEVALISLGVTIAYSSAFTLTNNSSKISRGILGDARCAKPTAMTAVPLILDRIIKGVFENVEKQGKLKTKLFKEALKYKQSNENSFTGRIFDRIIFNKVKAELGGSLKMMVIGGSPLSPQTHKMIRAMFGCSMQIGYGCTETAASVTSVDTDDTFTSHVGAPNAFVKVKLIDWEEGDYRTTDKPRPRGEVVVGGPNVANGYYKLESETSENFYNEDECQWFKTGDIGEFDDKGVLYVIDRKKDLVKLKHGEYISLGNVESILKTSALVENICAFANPHEAFAVAIVIPSKCSLEKIAASLGISNDSYEKLCVDQNVNKAFLSKLKAHGKQSGLTKWDIPQEIYLTSTLWTPDNGLVTAALKLKRKAIEKEYKDTIQTLYNKSASIE